MKTKSKALSDVLVDLIFQNRQKLGRLENQNEGKESIEYAKLKDQIELLSDIHCFLRGGEVPLLHRLERKRNHVF